MNIKELLKESVYIPFKTIDNYYVYDANQNSIIPISEKLFLFLKSSTKEENVSETIIKEFKELYKQGYLNSFSVKEIEHPSTSSAKIKLERNLTRLILQVTQNCNLRCSYCPYSQNNNLNRSHSTKNMTWEIAKRSIDFFYQHSIDSDFVELNFYGGEPLLNFKLIEKATKYFDELFKGRKRRFSFTTNGTIFDDTILSFLDKYRFSITISLDGPKEIHNMNRKYYINGKGSFDNIDNNLSLVESKYPKLYTDFQINTVIDPRNRLIDYLKLLDDNHICSKLDIQAAIIDDSFSDKKNNISDEYRYEREYYEFMVILHMANYFDFSKELQLLSSQIESLNRMITRLMFKYILPKKSAPFGPCLPGQLRLTVDVDGRFLPCEKVSETNPDNIIGNIENGFNIYQVKKLLNLAKYTENDCKSCFAFRFCSLCTDSCINGIEDIESKKKECELRKMQILDELVEVTYINEIKRKEVVE